MGDEQGSLEELSMPKRDREPIFMKSIRVTDKSNKIGEISLSIDPYDTVEESSVLDVFLKVIRLCEQEVRLRGKEK